MTIDPTAYGHSLLLWRRGGPIMISSPPKNIDHHQVYAFATDFAETLKKSL
jgi:hypothetical protein